MKSTYQLCLFCLIAIGVWSCKSFEGGQVNVTPDPLEVHGDSIEFDVNVNVPPNSGIPNDITYSATPELGDYTFNTVTITEKEYPNARQDGLEETFTFKAPYIHEDMDANYLEIEHEYTKPNGKTKKLGDMDDLATCCIRTSQLFMMNTEFMFSHVEVGGTQPLKLVAQFNFPLNKWQLDKDEFTDDDVQRIINFLEREDTDNTIHLIGAASPEGPYDRNDFLSKNRLRVVKESLQSELRAAGYVGEANIEFVENYKTEDWQGFEYKVRNSSLSSALKQNLIDVANSDANPEQKEAMLLDLLDGDVRQVEEQLQPLRRTTMVVHSDASMTDAMIDSIAMEYATGSLNAQELQDIFSREEWLETAQRTYAERGEKSLLVAYYNAYPDDYRIYNDLAILSLVDAERTDWDEVTVKYDESDNDLKMTDDERKLKMDDDELKYKSEDGKVKYEADDNDLKIKGKTGNDSDYKVKMHDGDMKIKTDEVKIKYEVEDDEFKYKSDDMKVKVEDGIMTVETDDYEWKYEDVNARDVAMVYMEDYERAQQNLERAFQANSNDNVVLSNLGAVWLVKRDYAQAKQHLINSLEVRETTEANYNLGLVYAVEGNYDKALAHFDRIENVRSRMLYNIGLTKLLAQDFSGAEEDLRAFVRAHPDQVWGYYLLAVVGARTNNLDMATSNIRKVCDMDEEACEYAEDDLEFAIFEDNDEFEDALDD